MNIETLKSVVEVVASIGAILFIGGYGVSTFMRGRFSGNKDTIENENNLTTYLKNQIDAFKSITDDQNKKITDMGKEIASLRAAGLEKERTIDKYLEILQNRNPELENSIKEISGTMKSINTFMEKINVHMEQDLKISGIVTH